MENRKIEMSTVSALKLVERGIRNGNIENTLAILSDVIEYFPFFEERHKKMEEELEELKSENKKLMDAHKAAENASSVKRDRPKPNRCLTEFLCDDMYSSDCVYYQPGEGGECKYMSPDNHCVSTVAQVNLMTIKIKEFLKGI